MEWTGFKGVKIYPNPTGGNARIRYELAGTTKKVEIEIHDAGGRLKKTIDGVTGIGINEISDDFSSQANGVYFVKITADKDGGGQDVVVKKLVVKK
jgi:hypothetical protein